MNHLPESLRDRPIRRDAFTLVELLVAITIMGILIAILLPAVQAARDTARRTKCANNLKQIGLALMHYHGQSRSLPSGYATGVTSAGVETGPGWGWLVMAMPYLEESSLRNMLDIRQPIESTANKARTQLVSGLLCPANEISRPTWAAERRDASGNPMSLICRVAFCAYVGMYGSTDETPAGDGLFFRNSRVRFQDITDGTSQTIAAGERAYVLGDGTWVGAVTGASMFPDAYDHTVAVPHLKPSSAMVLSHAGLGNGPNSPTSEINQFYSLHGAGVNYVFADGHVAYLPANIDYPVYRGMSTRAGGEGSGSY
jgi:prepilin-type N-terminal cleavage/methylation domain-containing protein/prepilin-type processing-associated H-X9-DG protein